MNCRSRPNYCDGCSIRKPERHEQFCWSCREKARRDEYWGVYVAAQRGWKKALEKDPKMAAFMERNYTWNP